MKKLMYLVLLAAGCSLMFKSCKGKDKEHSDDDMDSLTRIEMVADRA